MGMWLIRSVAQGRRGVIDHPLIPGSNRIPVLGSGGGVDGADGAPQVIALAGRTGCRSGDGLTGKRPLHQLSAWPIHQRLVLAQEAVDIKDNGLTSLLTLLDRLNLTGRIVTIDVISCQRDIVHRIVHGGAEHVLALKANHPDREPVDHIDRLTVGTRPDACHVSSNTSPGGVL